MRVWRKPCTMVDHQLRDCSTYHHHLTAVWPIYRHTEYGHVGPTGQFTCDVNEPCSDLPFPYSESLHILPRKEHTAKCVLHSEPPPPIMKTHSLLWPSPPPPFSQKPTAYYGRHSAPPPHPPPPPPTRTLHLVAYTFCPTKNPQPTAL